MENETFELLLKYLPRVIVQIIDNYLRPPFLLIENINITNDAISFDLHYYRYKIIHNHIIQNTKTNRRKFFTFSKNLNTNKRSTIEIYKRCRTILYIDCCFQRRYITKKFEHYPLLKCEYDNICYEFNRLTKLF